MKGSKCMRLYSGRDGMIPDKDLKITCWQNETFSDSAFHRELWQGQKNIPGTRELFVEQFMGNTSQALKRKNKPEKLQNESRRFHF